MRNMLKIIGGVALGILAFDFFGFCMWILSGQQPLDNFYIGTITAHILRAISF